MARDPSKNVVNVVSWRQRVKRRLIEYKGGKCLDCGYDKDCPTAFAFHHRDPKEKSFTISGKTKSFERIKEEADKCDLLCCRCHAERHDREFAVRRTEATKRMIDKEEQAKANQFCKGIDCGNPLSGNQDTYCSQPCFHYSRRKVLRPDRETLAGELVTMTMVALGRKYGVSDNAVRKWAKSYGLL